MHILFLIDKCKIVFDQSKRQVLCQIHSIFIKIAYMETLLFPFFLLADPAQNHLTKIRNLHQQAAGCFCLTT